MAPGATLTWNTGTGTLTAATPLATPLPNCTAGQDVWAQVYGLMSAHPALFQLEATEWRTPEPFDCQYVGDHEILSIGRSRLAGRPLAKDVFVYSLARIKDTVQLSAVNGTYVPVAGPAVGEAMAACNTLTAADATATARKTPLPATTYAQCRRIGSVAYTPKANDAFAFAPDEVWDWEPGTGQVQLIGQRTLRVTVAPSNYTRELLASDARCPVPDGDGTAFTVGFDVVFDIHTGAIVSVKPGLDCVVC
jgi:hypothetical protein